MSNDDTDGLLIPLHGMQSLHAVLGTEPANSGGLSPEARIYSQQLASLTRAIEGEQRALFSGERPTGELLLAWNLALIARDTYLQYRGSGPLSPTEETS